MNDYKLKQITETSWILTSSGNRLAVITTDGNSYSAIGRLDEKRFENLEELRLYLGGNLSIEEPEEYIETESGNVDGYPIKHQSAYDVKTEEYPSYAKTQGSSNRFAAGYYGVKFSHGWVHSFCPKISTLQENEWLGPFRTKIEMSNAITQRKNAPRI
jgi:hypothetical protein